MSMASKTEPRIGTTARRRALLQASAGGAGAAAAANLAVWAGGRAADVSFTVSPPVGDITFAVDPFMIVLATVSMFAVGAGALAWAARRSLKWARALVVGAVVVAVGSAGSPWMATDDVATALLLASMHLITGAAFVVTASRAGTQTSAWA